MEEAPAKKPRKPKPQLTPAQLKRRKQRREQRNLRESVESADWVAIRAMWLAGMKSDVLEEKFNVPANYIRAIASKEKWLEGAISSTPKLVADHIAKERGAQTAQLISELWADRGELIREKEFVVAEKVARHAEKMDEDALINKMDKVKIAFDMGRRASGLDKTEANPNAVNIAVLGEIGVYDGESEIYRSKPIDKP